MAKKYNSYFVDTSQVFALFGYIKNKNTYII
jgi:hypothetical protein